MMRITLFLLTNLSVMFIFGIILSLTGIQKESVHGLILMAGLVGFGGSLISLLMSKWLALNSIKAHIIKKPTEEIEHWIFNIVKYHSNNVGIKIPEIAIYQDSNINAFATGARRDSSLIAISSGLLKSMNAHEAEAVIAHEISHIANGDMVTMTLLQGIVNTFVIFLSRIIAQISTNVLNNNENGKHITRHSASYSLISMILEIVFGVLASIITMWFSRYREFKADAGAANLVGKTKMIAALEHLKKSSVTQPQLSKNIVTLCINGRSSSSIGNLFLSHPSIDKRINALYMNTYINE